MITYKPRPSLSPTPHVMERPYHRRQVPWFGEEGGSLMKEFQGAATTKRHNEFNISMEIKL